MLLGLNKGEINNVLDDIMAGQIICLAKAGNLIASMH